MTTGSFLDTLKDRARAERRRIAFPESADPRILAAAARLRDDGVAEPVLILDPSNPASHDAALALGVETYDPSRDARLARVNEDLLARRRGRGLSEEQLATLARHPLYFADDMLLHGEIDGCVAGCVYTTGDVMRAALGLIGPAHGVGTVSSAFYMATAPFRGSATEVLTFTDCAVVRYPTAAQLADIAVAASHDRRRIVGDAPVVAFLSFSTAGSADGESVTRVREAVELARAREPSIPFDGELQGDAALIPAVAHRKSPGSDVAGRANILVFPSLDAANIAYKLVERIAGASAVGPILQGLAKPCNDLSRGASPDDIMSVAAVTALQASDSSRRQREPSGDME